MRFLAFVLSFVSSVAFASEVGVQCRLKVIGVKLSDVAMNGSASTRTFTVADSDLNPNAAGASSYTDHLAWYRNMSIQSQWTRTSTGTITYTCTGTIAPEFSGPTATLTTQTVSSGTATLNWSGVIVTPSMSASKDWITRLGIGGVQKIRCVAEQSGTPASGDILTAIVSLWGC
jgi:hypothetical protein